MCKAHPHITEVPRRTYSSVPEGFDWKMSPPPEMVYQHCHWQIPIAESRPAVRTYALGLGKDQQDDDPSHPDTAGQPPSAVVC